MAPLIRWWKASCFLVIGFAGIRELTNEPSLKVNQWCKTLPISLIVGWLRPLVGVCTGGMSRDDDGGGFCAFIVFILIDPIGKGIRLGRNRLEDSRRRECEDKEGQGRCGYSPSYRP